MELKIFYRVVVPIVVLLLLITCTSCSIENKEVYYDYYTASEDLLDEIDKDYKWSIDTLDEKGSALEYRYWVVLADIKSGSRNYKDYYDVIQELLAYLECKYGWSDTTSGKDAYCRYCEAKESCEYEREKLWTGFYLY